MATSTPDGERIASSPLFKGLLSKAESYLKQPLRIKQLLNDAYQKASNKKDIGHLAHEAWESMQTLFRLVKFAVSGEYTGVPAPTVLAAVAVLIYFLSPIDLVPDFIPVVGLLDDVALMAWFTTTLKAEMDKFSEWEKSRPYNIPVPAASFEAASSPRPGSQLTSTSSPLEKAEHSVSSGSFVESPESAKRAGQADLPGGSNPDPANSAPDADTPVTHAEHDPAVGNTPNPNVTAASISGSRDPRLSDGRGGDTGGNVR